MSDELDWSTRILAGGGFISLLLAMWIALLKYILGKYVITLEANTAALTELRVRVARIEGRMGIKEIAE